MSLYGILWSLAYAVGHLSAKSHVAAIDANISKAAKYAFQAQADAYEAARVAAVARQASADANNYAAQAATYKNNAAA
ncbi:hypothetical protein V3C41_10145 [Paenarthrobacter nicotinovorans]|uniref:Uncharacterized protein n=1 Tax=Paenarthrobacter nicotinovorans TaxID=29320 RepID=A0ABV0GSH7_PAENI